MEEWKEYKYTELCTLIGGGTPKTSEASYWGGDIPWLSVKDFGTDRKYVYTTEKTITKDGLEKSSTKLLQKDDIIISARGTIGAMAMIVYPMAFNQSCFGIRGNDLVDKDFLYYLTKTKIAELQKNSHGSVFETITRDTFAKLSCIVPPLKKQEEISSILSSLDSKIEVNRRINENLEQQAQALFKSWFVDFEPFKDQPFVESELGMIPQGWRVVSLDNLMTYNGGSQPPASEFIDHYEDGYIRFIQIRDYASDGHITYIPISKRNKLCDVRDIMIARYGASLGRICYGLKGAYNVALAKVTPVKEYYLEYLRCFLNTREFYEGINNKGNRAVQAGFNQSDIQSFRIAFPGKEEILMRFEDTCSRLFDMRLKNEQESHRLAELRDTLLPKLMSGEINVNEVKI